MESRLLGRTIENEIEGDYMRQKLSLMIMEGPDEKIAVEIYKDGPKALEAFSNLAGKPGDSPSRATFLLLDQEKGTVVHHEKKDLPIVKNPEEEPWGHRLGVGAIDKPEEESDKSSE